MDEQEIITKKIEELRKYIPAIESKIKIIQGNPVFQTQLDKFLYMRKTIISGRAPLKILESIERAIATCKLNKTKRQNIPAEETNLKRVKLERPDILTIKTEHSASIQSPESPPMNDDVRKSEPITIPIERKESRGYLYERDFSKSDRSHHRSFRNEKSSSSYKDQKYDRDDRHYRGSRERERRSRSRDRRSRSREGSRDRRSDSYERDRRSRSIERDRNGRSGSRDRKGDYRSGNKYYRDDDGNKKYYKPDPDSKYKDRLYYDRNRFNNEQTSYRSRSPPNRNNKSVFNRIGPKIQEGKLYKKDLHLVLKQTALQETIQADLAELDIKNEERFGISEEAKKCKQEKDELATLIEIKKKMEEELVKESQESLAKQLRIGKTERKFINPQPSRPTDELTNLVEQQISSNISNRESISLAAQKLERQNSESLQSNTSSSTERLAYKYNRKIRPRDGSSSSDGQDSNSPYSNNTNPSRISSTIGIVQNDPRLKNRANENTAFNTINTHPLLHSHPVAPPPPQMNNPFNKFQHGSPMPIRMPCNPMPGLSTVNPNNLRHIHLQPNQYIQPPYGNPMLHQRNRQDMPGPSNPFREQQIFHNNMPPERRNDFINSPPPFIHRSESMEQARKPTYKEHRLAKEREMAKNQVTSPESTVTSESNTSPTSTENSESTVRTQNSEKESANEVESSTTSKTPHFDNAFRTYNWETLDGVNKDKLSFKIPKLNKKDNSQTSNDADVEIPLSKTPEKRINKRRVSTSEATSSKKDKTAKEQIETAEKPNEPRKTRKRRKSIVRPASPEEVASTEAIEPDPIDNIAVVPERGEAEENNTPTSTSVETPKEDTAKSDQIVDIINTMLNPNVENMVSFWKKLVDPQKLDRIKAILYEKKVEAEGNQSTETNETNETVVSSSTTASTTKAVANTTESNAPEKPIIEAKEVVKRIYKKKSNELSRLNEDIRTMFISDGVLTATGRRACTLYQNQNPNQSPSPPKTKAKSNKTRSQPEKESESEVQEDTPKPKKIRGRRNTTVEKEIDHFNEPLADQQPTAKRISRRRGTICEVVDHPPTSDDGMPPIKLKFKTMDSSATFKKPKSRDRSISAESSGTEKTISDTDAEKRKKPEEEKKKKKKVSFCPTTENEYKVDEEIEEISNKKKPTQDRSSKYLASHLTSCKVVLEKVDSIPQRITRAQKRTAEESDHSDDSSLLVPQISTPKKQCDEQPGKNINPEMYLTNPKFTTKCLVCKFHHHNGVISHYVNKHSDIEVYISRPSPKMAKRLLNECQEAKVVNRKYMALCYFCETEHTFSPREWFKHMTRHTGEFERYCKKCDYKIVDQVKRTGNCDHSDLAVWNKFEVKTSLDAFICKLCNYTQLKEESLKTHVRSEHEIHHRISNNYKKVALLQGFRKRAGVEKADISDTASSSERDEPVNSDVFKPSKQDDGLFDDHTMKLMKEVTFSDSEVPRPNSFTMANKLSERFRKQDEAMPLESEMVPKEEPTTVEITYKNAQTDLDDRSDNDYSKKVLPCSSNSNDVEQSIKNDKYHERNAVTAVDDNDWESCSNDSTEVISNDTESVTSSKNNYIATTLNRLYSQIGKPKAKECKPIKLDKQSNETLESTELVRDENSDAGAVDSLVSDSFSLDDLNIPPTTKTLKRVQNIGLSECVGKIEYCCFIGHCNYESTDLKKFLNHLPQHRQGWEGFCYTCDKQLHNQSYSLKKELNHLKEVHLDKYKNNLPQHPKDVDLQTISASDSASDSNSATSMLASAVSKVKITVNPISVLSPAVVATPAPTVVSAPTPVPTIASAPAPVLTVTSVLTPVPSVASAPTRAPVPRPLLKIRRLSGDTLSTPSLQSNTSSTLFAMRSNFVPHSAEHIAARQAELSGNDWLKHSLNNVAQNPVINLSMQNMTPIIPTLPTFSTSIQPSAQPSNVRDDFNSLKPWTKCPNLKFTSDCVKMLREKSLMHLYKCMGQNCSYTVDDGREMLNHLRNHEELASQQVALGQSNYDTSSWLECPYCEETADSCSILVKHIDTEHMDSIYQCNLCLYRSVSECNMQEHRRQYHNSLNKSYFICDGTPKDISKEMAGILSSRLTYVKAINCGYGGCNQSFYVLSEFMHHINYELIHTQTNVIQCFICKSSIERIKAVKHLFEHQIGLFQCVYCSYGVPKEADIRIHLADCHLTKLSVIAVRIRGDSAEVTTTDIESTCLVELTEIKIDDSSTQPQTLNANTNAPKTTNSVLSSMLQGKPLPLNTIGSGARNTRTIMGVKLLRYSEFAGKLKPHISNRTVYENPNVTIAKTLSSHLPTPSTSKQTLPTKSNLTASTSTENPKSVLYKNSDQTNISSTNKSIQDEIDQSAQSLLKGSGLDGEQLYRCGSENCSFSGIDANVFNVHLLQHKEKTYICYHCRETFDKPVSLKTHIKCHGVHRFFCNCCNFTGISSDAVSKHFSEVHKQTQIDIHPLNPAKKDMNKDIFIISPNRTVLKDFGLQLVNRNREKILSTKKFYLPEEVDMLPHQSIFTEKISCKLCNYGSKVRANIHRHLSKGDCIVNATMSGIDPVNPVPCLDTGEKYFDKMFNLAASSNPDGTPNRDRIDQSIQFVPEERRFVCGAKSCHYQNNNEDILKQHINALHGSDKSYNCVHCNKELSNGKIVNANNVILHLRFHDSKIFKCPSCQFFHFNRTTVDKHLAEMHPKCKDKTLEFNRQPKQISDSVKQAKGSNVIYKWKCNICFESKFDTRALVKRHLQEVHRLNYQYQCTLCSFQNDTKGVIKDHLICAHGGQDTGKFKVFFERVEGRDDNTPIWQRNDPNRIKHIRGILVEEEEIHIEDTTTDEIDSVHYELEKSFVSKGIKKKKTPKIIRKPSKPAQIGKMIESPVEQPANVAANKSNDNNSDNDVEWIPSQQVETICIDEDNDTEKGTTTEKNLDKNISAVLEKNGIKTELNAESITNDIGKTIVSTASEIVNHGRDSLPAKLGQTPQLKAATAKCTICHKRISITESLKQHYKTEHPAIVLNRTRNLYIYICYHCEYSNDDFEKVFEHWVEQHKNSTVTSSKSTAKLNLMNGRPFWFKVSKMVRCLYCADKISFNEIRMHFDKNHPTEYPVTTGLQKGLSCGHCDKTFSNSIELKEHYTKSHQPFYRMQLDSEPLDFITEKILLKLTKHGCSDKCKCLLCHEIFDNKKDFNKHQQTHHATKFAQCSTIDGCLNVHYGCSICRESFTNEKHTLEHIRGHNLQYMCKFCDKKVNYLKLIKSHHEIMHNSTDLTYRNVNVRENLGNYLKMTITFANGLTLTKADAIHTTFGNIDLLIKYIEELNAVELEAVRMNPLNHTN